MTPPVLVPPQPARVRVGDRDVPIPTAPASTTPPNDARRVELVADGPDRLVLTPVPRSRWSSWLVGGLCLALGLGFAGTGAIDVATGEWAGLILVVGGLLPLGFGGLIVRDVVAGLGPRRHTFDRSAGTLVTDRRQGRRGPWEVESSRPLAGVAVVQLLYTGSHTATHTSDAGTSHQHYHSYELNLVWDDGSRATVCAHPDWEWMRVEGGRLGGFPGVPVADQLAPGS